MARPVTKQSLQRQTKKAMESLGVYRKEYDPLIEIYAGMLHYLSICEKEFEDSGMQVVETSVNSKGVVSEKKSPLVQTMESLRKDILSYSDKLCLNPKAISDEKNRSDKNKPQGLESIVDGIINGG